MPPNKPNELADTLRKVLALDTPYREELAARAISNVRENFSRAQMCAKTINVYDEIMG